MPRKKKPIPRQRRARGSGSVSWDAKRARWRGVYKLPTGRRTSRYFKDEAAALAWLAQQDQPLAPQAQTVESALADLLASRDYLKSGTKTNYTIYSARIALILGDLPVTAVTPKDVERMDQEHRRILSGNVADQILTLFSTLYERLIALETPGVVRNPIKSYRVITPPRARAGRPPRNAVALDAGMCRLLLKALKGNAFYPHVAWLLTTGMRVGELRGLRWVNVTASEIRIVEQRLLRDRHTPAPLKTAHVLGEGRIIPTPPYLLDLTPHTESELVFPGFDGGAFTNSGLRRWFTRACASAKLPPIHIHDLRHTANSGWADLGASERMCQALLGHTPKSMTGHYTHPGLAALRPVVDAWAELILGDRAVSTLKQIG